MSRFGDLWKRNWHMYLLVFLLMGFGFTGAQMLADLYPDEAWASLLAAVPGTIVMMYFLNLRQLPCFSFNVVWIEFYALVAQIAIFALICFVPLARTSKVYTYSMVTLMLVLWAIITFVHAIFFAKPLMKAFHIPPYNHHSHSHSHPEPQLPHPPSPSPTTSL